MAKKRLVYLTHIELHARGFRPTLSFAKAAEKGRMYVPTDANTFNRTSEEPESSNKREFVITLPDDLKKSIADGKVELMIPEGGLYFFAGKDLIDMMAAREKHANRDRVWHSPTAEV